MPEIAKTDNGAVPHRKQERRCVPYYFSKPTDEARLTIRFERARLDGASSAINSTGETGPGQDEEADQKSKGDKELWLMKK